MLTVVLGAALFPPSFRGCSSATFMDSGRLASPCASPKIRAYGAEDLVSPQGAARVPHDDISAVEAVPGPLGRTLIPAYARRTIETLHIGVALITAAFVQAAVAPSDPSGPGHTDGAVHVRQ